MAVGLGEVVRFLSKTKIFFQLQVIFSFMVTVRSNFKDRGARFGSRIGSGVTSSSTDLKISGDVLSTIT